MPKKKNYIFYFTIRWVEICLSKKKASLADVRQYVSKSDIREHKNLLEQINNQMGRGRWAAQQTQQKLKTQKKTLKKTYLSNIMINLLPAFPYPRRAFKAFFQPERKKKTLTGGVILFARFFKKFFTQPGPYVPYVYT